MTTSPPFSTDKPSGADWIGHVPIDWGVKRFKFLLTEPLKYGANETAELSDADLPRYIRITDVKDDGALRHETFRSLPEEIAKPYLLEEGDILLARSGATVGKTFIYKKSWGRAAFAGYLVRARVKKEILDANFAYYFLQSSAYWQWLNSVFIQSTIQNVSAEKYANLFVPFPGIVHQKAIVRFLGYKTAQIDTLIAKKQALLEKLAEKRTALISHAVTMGLDPSVPMKDSGVAWLGEIPQHWQSKRLRFLTTMSGGMTPSTGVPEYWNGDVPWVSPKDMKSEELSASIDTLTEKAVSDTGIRLHDSGRVLIVVRGMILAHTFPVAVNTVPVTVNQDMKALSSSLNHDYLALLLRGIQGLILSVVDESAHGTKVLRTDVFKNIFLPVPPDDEQKIIVQEVCRLTKRLDEQEKTVHAVIDRLNEYRSALITNAVTGKIDVRNFEIPLTAKEPAHA